MRIAQAWPSGSFNGAIKTVWMSEHQIWDVEKVQAFVANQEEAVTFFCGGLRNFAKFIDLFDGVFVLEVDLDTMNRRIDEASGTGPKLTSAENQRNGNSLCACIRRKKTFRKTASSSVRHRTARARR